MGRQVRTRVDNNLPEIGGLAVLRLAMRWRAMNAGFRIRHRLPGAWFSGRSWCNPITRTIWLRHDADIDTPAGVALLAHEVAHARQQSGRLPYRLAWGLRYLLDPWFRRRAEVEAEAWWVAVMVRLDGGRTPFPVCRYAEQSHTLGSWRAPHYTPGDPDHLTDAIAERAREILE